MSTHHEREPCAIVRLGERIGAHKDEGATGVAQVVRCVLCKRLPREHGELCEPCWEAGQDWMRDEEREATE